MDLDDRCWIAFCFEKVVNPGSRAPLPSNRRRPASRLCDAHLGDWAQCAHRMAFGEFCQAMYSPVIWERMREWMET